MKESKNTDDMKEQRTVNRSILNQLSALSAQNLKSYRLWI